MADLAAFKGASADLAWREERLLASCDLVFAGGPGLYVARKDRYPCVFCREFDVCLLPFALNGATRPISTTKALEYMAAGKPIVSAAAPDVAASWPKAVVTAAGPDGFAAAVEAMLEEPAEARATRERRQAALVAVNGWGRVTGEMGDLVAAALGANDRRG